MFRRLGRIAFLLSVSLSALTCAKAQCCLSSADWPKFHRKDIRTWSVKSGLPARTIQAILNSIDEDQYLIQRIDMRSLSSRGQILVALTDFGTAHWLSVNVVQARPPYRDLWHTRSIAQYRTCSEVDLGTESVLGEATASATKDGRVLINIPERRNENDNGVNPKTQLLVATYIWAGKTYHLKDEEVFSSYGWNGNDYVTHGRGTPPKCAQSPLQ